jgi:hypothetical protein
MVVVATSPENLVALATSVKLVIVFPREGLKLIYNLRLGNGFK